MLKPTRVFSILIIINRSLKMVRFAELRSLNYARFLRVSRFLINSADNLWLAQWSSVMCTGRS